MRLGTCKIESVGDTSVVVLILFYLLVFNIFVLLATYVCYQMFS